MRPTKAVLLYDQTGAANTAFQTTTIPVADYDCLLVELIPSAAPTAASLSVYDADFSVATALLALATAATVATKTASLGAHAYPAAVGEYVGGLPGALPNNIQLGIGALGAGVTARIRVIGRRNFKESVGPFDNTTHLPIEA